MSIGHSSILGWWGVAGARNTDDIESCPICLEVTELNILPRTNNSAVAKE